MARISVIVPTWGATEWTIRCFKALKKHTHHDVHLIWIDNGSTKAEHDRVVPFAKEFFWDWEFHPKPIGFPKAINRGLKHVKGPYVVLLNNDVEVMPGWDKELKNAVDKRPGAAGLMAVQSGGWQSTKLHPWLGIPKNLNDRYQIHKLLRGKWAGTVMDVPAKPTRPNFRGMLAFFCTMFPTKVLQRVGGLDEQFGWGFGDDDDYAMRLRRAGYHLSLCPGACVFHGMSQTIKKIPGGINAQLRKNAKLVKAKWGRNS